MLNPIASEAIFSATYVDNYIDSVENLPDDVQRQLSRIRDIDVQYRSHLRDVDHYYDLWKTLQNSGDSSANRRSRAIMRMQQSLIQAQELGDEKMQIVNQLQELIDHKTRQLDSDQKNLDIKEEQQQNEMQGGSTPVKVARTQSPIRENLPTNGLNSSEVGGCKELGMYSGYSGGNSASSGNGASTPTLDRSVHPMNSSNAQLNANIAGNGSQACGNNLNLNSAESQRTASKRSRRRNETVTQMELCGNESNSANETVSSVGGNVGVDKNTLVGNIATTSQKQSTVCGSSSASHKKNSMQGQNSVGNASGSTGSGGGIGSGTGGGNSSGKKKKRKARGAQASSAQNMREETPPLDPIDPDEPTYCLCDQISFGEMILCDNDLCPIEWFHFSCVSLVLKPKGKWYCPNCRGDRPNVMKPKAQFLKELERYNKEKEEKT